MSPVVSPRVVEAGADQKHICVCKQLAYGHCGAVKRPEEKEPSSFSPTSHSLGYGTKVGHNINSYI